MKSKFGTWSMTIVTGLAIVLMTLPVLAAEKKPSGDPAAKVNGSVITQKELDRELSRATEQLLQMGRPVSDTQLSEMRKRMLDNLIAYELLYQESKKKGVKVTDAAVDEKMNELKKQYPDEAEFKTMLSSSNLTEADLKSHMKRGIAVEQLVDREIVQKITVTDKEMRAYYDSNLDRFKQPEQVKASHILIKVDPEADESEKGKARKQIETIQKKVKKGEDFEALAKEHSGCPSSTKGGDLGYFGRGQMVKPFEDTAFALKPGQVSDIVETRFGYHLIKVTDKKPAMTVPFEEVKERISERQKQQQVREKVLAYVEDLRGKAKVETFLVEKPVEKSG
ncbi:MAG: peptidylprolyl isomerase [Deltaproteobacteria bacterium]|nr:peptidylprolyl isomerase [Deltaproteobacteria bacterium]